LESVYREAMRLALHQAGLIVRTEVEIPVYFRDALIGRFRADLVVNSFVLIELKTCEGFIREHESQILNYLKATEIEVTLLMNFGPAAKFKRFVMDNQSKKNRSQSVKSVEIGVKPFLES
jgi:GxxExxY protein